MGATYLSNFVVRELWCLILALEWYTLFFGLFFCLFVDSDKLLHEQPCSTLTGNKGEDRCFPGRGLQLTMTTCRVEGRKGEPRFSRTDVGLKRVLLTSGRP